MLRWCELVMAACLGCQIMRAVTVISPDSLNYDSTFTRVLLSGTTLIPLIAAMIGYFYLRFCGRQEQAKRVFRLFSQCVTVLSLSALIVYVSLLICNTIWPGSAGIFSEAEALIFNGQWGSYRGTTWMDGLKVWGSFDPKRKLLGAGPDCFAAYAYSHGEIGVFLKAQFGGVRLTNAHNEVLTILVDQGVIGAVVFLGMVAAGIREGFKGIMSGRDPEVILWFGAVLSVFVYGQFSFEQVMITPYFYLMLGLIYAYTSGNKAELEEIPQSL
jgi:O-antigen ligase